MVREVTLLEYVPDYYKEFLEMQEIQRAIQPESQGIVDETVRMLQNQFIMDADADGIQRYEDMLQIQPFDNDSLEDRRFRVLSKWNRTPPYTRIALRRKLASLCGEDGYALRITPDKKLIVRIEIKSKRNFTEVEKLLEGIVPCDMEIDLSLLYNQHKTLRKFTHRQLSEWTHKHIRNEVLPDGI